MARWSMIAAMAVAGLGASAAAAATPKAAPDWIPTWFASPAPADKVATLTDKTVRQVVHIAAGGRRLRIRLSNAYGATPLRIDAVRLGLRGVADAVRPGSNRMVRFQGHGDVTIAPGAFVESDPVDLAVAAQADLAISLHVASAQAATVHVVQRDAVYVADGDQTDSPSLTTSSLAALGASPTGQSILWLSEVEVSGSPARGVVAAFGDSITDGVGPPPGSDATWPDVLEGRLLAAGVRLGMFNAGIGGNRLLHAGSWAPFGPAALARFDADVLAQPHVKAVIVLIGINDIGQPGQSAPAGEAVSAQAIEDGLCQLAERAHEKGLKIYAATLTPFKITTIAGYYSPEKEAERQAVNTWIRASRAFDGVVDFDKAMEDPAAPGQMRPAYDSGDHLHPSAAGDRALGEAVPLRWFGVK